MYFYTIHNLSNAEANLFAILQHVSTLFICYLFVLVLSSRTYTLNHAGKGYFFINFLMHIDVLTLSMIVTQFATGKLGHYHRKSLHLMEFSFLSFAT